MLRNYFKTSWRNLTGSKFYSLLNIMGLTTGLAVGILILIWVTNETGYDLFHKNASSLYRVNVELESSNGKFTVQVVQPTVAFHALTDVPGIRNAVRVTDNNDYAVFRYKTDNLKGDLSIYSDASLFKMFEYPVLAGDKENPLPRLNSVVITKTAAHKYFGNEDPIGKILVGDNKDNFEVTAMIADFPDNSWLKCDMIFSTEFVRKQRAAWGWRPFDADWGNYGWVTFLQLEPGISQDIIAQKLTKINIAHQPAMKPSDAGGYSLQALRDIHLYNPDGSPAALKNVRIFSIVAILILLVASINYVNLSTARAMLRFKEVSVRKIIGAGRFQLFAQFMVQTILFFGISLLLAIGVILIVMPLYNQLSGKELSLNLADYTLWSVVSVTLAVTLLASSIYPAILLSSFKPIQALRGTILSGFGNTMFRKVLVVVQFSFSAAMIMATLIIGRQLEFIRNKSLGFDKDLVVSINLGGMEKHYEAVRSELMQQPGVVDAASATNNISFVYGSTLDVDWDGKNPDAGYFITSTGIDKDFIGLFKIGLKEGKNFIGAVADSSHFILNESAVKAAGIKDPVGKRFRLGRTTGTIIGVVNDFHFRSLHQKIQPFVFYYQSASSKLFVRIAPNEGMEAMKAVEKIWSRYNDGFPFEYAYMDESYKTSYQAEQRTGLLFNVFAAIAIVISCLGLLGLAAYTAQVKFKEIGIRKVLGATAFDVASTLSMNFLILVVIAVFIAVPAAWFVMQKWLMDFEYRTNMSAWIFVAAAGATFVIAIAVIGGQSIRAALANPVDSLKE